MAPTACFNCARRKRLAGPPRPRHAHRHSPLLPSAHRRCPPRRRPSGEELHCASGVFEGEGGCHTNARCRRKPARCRGAHDAGRAPAAGLSAAFASGLQHGCGTCSTASSLNYPPHTHHSRAGTSARRRRRRRPRATRSTSTRSVPRLAAWAVIGGGGFWMQQAADGFAHILPRRNNRCSSRCTRTPVSAARPWAS